MEKNLANQTASASLTPGPVIPKVEDPGPLCAAHTPNFPALLRRLGASLLVTTYQAGKLVMVRDEGDHLNTHYRSFQSPMGLALADGGSKLAIGTTLQVWEFRDVPSVARRLVKAQGHNRSRYARPAARLWGCPKWDKRLSNHCHARTHRNLRP